MRVSKKILLTSVFFIIAGCVNTSGSFSNIDTVTYESTLSSYNIGYIDFYSIDLLNNTDRIYVNLEYIGKNGLIDTHNVQITNVQRKNGSVRIYIPSRNGERFNQADLIVDYGTIRVISNPINSPDWKYLEKGQSTVITSQNKKVTVTSEISLPGTYFASLLKSIRK